MVETLAIKCGTKGCAKPATWRIETQDEDGEYIDICVCDEHYPQDPAINEAFVSVKRIRHTEETTTDILGRRWVKHSTGTEFQEEYLR